MTRPATHRLGVVGLVVAAAALLTSCVQVPTAGPVVVAQAAGQGTSVEGPVTNPPPPQAGDSPQAIVKGFLNAMTATPIRTTVALKFLTAQARANWRPLSRTIIYGDAGVGGGTDVTLRLRGAHTLGVRGDWEGALPADRRTHVLPMRLEGTGRWRIARAPNAFIVPEVWYQQHYQTESLYYFDPTGRILVPEPVHLPEGDQLPTTLVRSLLIGPQEGLGQVARSFLPPGLSAALSVTVTHKGVAQVTLTGPNAGPLPHKTTDLMLAQLAWTLRQVPTVKAFEVTLGGTQVSDASGRSTFSVNAYDRYDPTKAGASAQLYALRRGQLVSGRADHLTPVDGPFGSRAVGIGAFAVSLDDTRIAGVTPYHLLTGSVRGRSRVHEVYAAGGPLLRPSWDFAGRLWDVERSARGARVVVVTGGHAHQVRVPGVTGEQVERFLVSRDGSRLVAVIRGRGADRLVVSRLRYDARGHVLGGKDTRRLAWQAGGIQRITDIGWASPTTVYVLHQLTHQFAEVRRITVDGSTTQSDASTATIDLSRQGLTGSRPGSISGRVRGLVTSPVTSPVDTQTSFAILPRSLVDLDQTAGSPAVPYRGLSHITYAG